MSRIAIYGCNPAISAWLNKEVKKGAPMEVGAIAGGNAGALSIVCEKFGPFANSGMRRSDLGVLRPVGKIPSDLPYLLPTYGEMRSLETEAVSKAGTSAPRRHFKKKVGAHIELAQAVFLFRENYRDGSEGANVMVYNPAKAESNDNFFPTVKFGNRAIKITSREDIPSDDVDDVSSKLSCIGAGLFNNTLGTEHEFLKMKKQFYLCPTVVREDDSVYYNLVIVFDMGYCDMDDLIERTKGDSIKRSHAKEISFIPISDLKLHAETEKKGKKKGEISPKAFTREMSETGDREVVVKLGETARDIMASLVRETKDGSLLIDVMCK